MLEKRERLDGADKPAIEPLSFCYRERLALMEVSRSGLKYDFGVTLNALIKLVIGHSCVVERNVIRDDKAWFGSARNDHVAQVAIVALHVALPCAEPYTFLE